ncbi:neurobeachin-like protein 1 isoform X2 [Hydra vulgaris]|uniref:neurobeachin-like protein 1 isoform X2 n=1 Tax=Hydra vulgaris TaxID=6087 RepID=UPI0032E9CB0C
MKVSFKGINLSDIGMQDILFLWKRLVCGEIIAFEADQKLMECFLNLFLNINLSDHIELLRSIVEMLKMKVNEQGMAVQCKICDTLSMLIQDKDQKFKEKYGKWKEIITNELVCVQLFEALKEMASVPASPDITNKKLATTFCLISVILNNNSYQRKKFQEVFGMKSLREVLFTNIQLDINVALSLFELLTISNYQGVPIEQRLITMKKLTNLIIDILPQFNDKGREKLCESLRVMCKSVPQNRYICSKIGLISNIVQLLRCTQFNLAVNIKNCLISLMETIGCLSISASELKMFIGLFQTVEFSLADRLVQALERMSSPISSEETLRHQPTHYIDFYNIYKNTYIQCPKIKNWSGSGVSVHMWVCLDFKLPNNIECKSIKTKHILYSFMNSDGGGFESFFTHNGFLVITVYNRKKYLSVTCTSSPFLDQEWHGLSIVYSRKLLAKDSVIVYVDGHEIEHHNLQFPTLNKEIVVGGLGCSAKFFTQLLNIPVPKCPLYDLSSAEWGSSTVLKGQIASFALFNESLSPDRIQDLKRAGSNSQLYFSVKELMAESADTSLMFNNVVLYYNAKAAVKNQLMNLSRHANQTKETKVDTYNMNASICRVFKIQETIQSIGGLSVLFPLLEKASFRHRKSSLFFPITDDVTSFSDTEGQYLSNSSNVLTCNKPNEKPTNGSSYEEYENGDSKFIDIENLKHKEICTNKTNENNSIDLVNSSNNLEVLDFIYSDESSKDIDLNKSLISIQSCEKYKSQISDNLEDWTFLDSKDIQPSTNRYWLPENSYESNGIAHFISLIRHMIDGRKNAALLELQGVRVIGYLLQKCDPILINISFLECLSKLVETLLGVNQVLLENIYQYILFDFNIWHRANTSVQIAHIQLLHNYIKEDPTSFSNLFGVEYFMQIVELHYGSVQVNQERCWLADQSDLRKSLIGLVKYLMKLSPNKENISLAVSYMSCVSNSECLDEVLDLVFSLIKSPNELSVSSLPLCSYLAEYGCYIMYRWLVHDIFNETRSKIINIFIYMIKFGNLTETLKQKLVLKDLFPAIGELLCKQEISKDVVLLLLKLGVSVSHSEEMKNDIFFNYQVVLSALRICQSLPVFVKLEVAIKVNHSLKLCPQSAICCANAFAWYEPIWMLIVANSPDESTKMQEEDLLFIVVDIIHSVIWNGVVGSDFQAWTKRIEPITSLHKLSSQFTFIQSALVIERQLYEKSLLTTAMALKRSTQLNVDLQNAEQMIKLVKDFVTNFEITGKNSEKWSSMLIFNVFVLLDAMGVWEDSTEVGNEWTEILQVTESFLYLAFQQTNSREVLETASNRLNHLLHKRKLPDFLEVCYQIYYMHDVLCVLQKHELSTESFLIYLLQCFEKYTLQFFYDDKLSDIPPLQIDIFKKDFLTYMIGEQYILFLDSIKHNVLKFENKAFSSSSLVIGKLWMNSMNSMSSSRQYYDQLIETALHEFSMVIYVSFDERRNEELSRLKNYENSYRQKNSITKKMWEYQKLFLKSERGTWKSSNTAERHFKLSNTENRYRMRLKLSENLRFNSHQDASIKRDLIGIPDMLKALPVNVPLALNPEDDDVEDTVESSVSQEDMSSNLHMLGADTGATIYASNCHLITLMDIVQGHIELTPTHLCFIDDQCSAVELIYDFKFALEELCEVYSRRYNLRKTALEFFLLDRSSFLVNFSTIIEKDSFYKKLIATRPVNLYYSGIQNPSQLLRASKLTNKWVEREISNFEYLMHLNTISGRTYNDLSQYPVFPWILSDYVSEKIDLNDESIYRDLSKPVGALNEERAKEINERYNTFVDVSGVTKKSHYFTHYSNPAGVLHYMLRVEPFTSLHVKLQGGRFDCPNRQFYSISNSWNSVMKGVDIKELIPEFFFFPEFLINMNKFCLGNLQDGTQVDDVILPPWAKDAYTFVHINRQALESEYVSNNLHSWIDLIFGYKQKGKEAEKALNIFSHYSYEGAVDLDSIEDSSLRESIEGMINNFGQVPTQLLKKPHPKRKKLQDVDFGKPKVVTDFNAATFSLIEISHKDPVVFIATSKPRERTILYLSLPDTLLSIHSNSLYGIHSWLPHTDPNRNPLSFTQDVKLSSTQRSLPGILSPSVRISSHLFGFSSDGRLMLSCGYWDNSIRVVSIERGVDTLKACVYYHNDVVTCLSIDPNGSHVITGSADRTCAIWKVYQSSGFSSGISEKPIQVIYGHDACLSDVSMYLDLDLAVTGAVDGVCLVHTIHKGIYMHTLLPSKILSSTKIEVAQIKLSEQGRIVVLYKSYQSAATSNFVCIYSINGSLLYNIVLSEMVSGMIILNNYLITGTESGSLQIRDVNDFNNVVYSKNVRSSISSVAASYNGSHLFIGRGDGNILVMCPTK